ncbi:MAG: ribonuclease HI family protein [Terriglobales bacterium]
MSSDIPQLVAYVDGSSHGSPGPAGIGVIVEDAAGRQTRIAKWIGWQDNNVAEYVALMEALQCALAQKARSLCVYSDSDVVVRQMSGEYACRSPRLYSLHWICRKLAQGLEFAIMRIPRERNREANDLANSAARGGGADDNVVENLVEGAEPFGFESVIDLANPQTL